MINSGYFDRSSRMLPIETRLIRLAKSGDVNAFVELCVPCIEWVYRYIYFLVPNNRGAEGLTIQVFFKAWEQIDRLPKFGAPFLIWLYSIAHIQLTEYQRTHKTSPAADNAVTLAARGDEFKEEFQNIRDGLRVLTADRKNILVLKYIVGIPEKEIARLLNIHTAEVFTLQSNALCALASHLNNSSTVTITKEFRHALDSCLERLLTGGGSLRECMIRHPKFSSQLEPVLETALLLDLGHDVTPLPAFINYTQDVLTQSLRFRPHRSQVISAPAVRRLAMAFAMLVAAFLATGTAYAQSALPGETMYGWKRASEQVWQTLAPHSVSLDLLLAERRLDEWIAVEDDPTLSATAMNGYQEALSKLETNGDEEQLALVSSALEAQQETLEEAGLTSPELDEYLKEVSVLLPENANPQSPVVIFTTPTVNAISPAAISTDEVTDICPPKCGNQNGDNSSNGTNNNGIGSGGNAGGTGGGGSSNSNAGGNGGGAGSSAGGTGGGGADSNAGGNDDPPGKDDDGGSNPGKGNNK